MGMGESPVPDSAEPISSAIVSAVADREDVDPRALDPPLQSVVDTDALNQLFEEPSDNDLRVEFQYAGYAVTVTGPERIEIDPVE